MDLGSLYNVRSKEYILKKPHNVRLSLGCSWKILLLDFLKPLQEFLNVLFQVAKTKEQCVERWDCIEKSLSSNPCHWLERSDVSDAVGNRAPTFCTFSSWQSTNYSCWEPCTFTGPWVCYIIKTTNNIFPLFDDDKQYSRHHSRFMTCSPWITCPPSLHKRYCTKYFLIFV